MPEDYAPLCWRCDHRIAFVERVDAEGISFANLTVENRPHCPRYECGDLGASVAGCYMYRPVVPVIIERDTGERRQLFAGAMIAARAHGVTPKRGREWKTRVIKDGSHYWLYWIPQLHKPNDTPDAIRDTESV